MSYLLRAYLDAGVIDILCNKSTIPQFTTEKLRSLHIPHFRPEEQRDAVTAVIVFGSVGRGEAGSGSDVDLAVIADGGWDDRARIQDAVRTRLVSDCDMLAFTSTEFSRLVAEGEPVVADILRDCVTLIGTMP